MTNDTGFGKLKEENLEIEGGTPKDNGENMDEDLLIDNKIEERRFPMITSLDEIPRYTNVFVSVYPFIFHGYRIHHSLKDCFFSLFQLHNETMNIWTHLLPFFAFIFLFIFELVNQKYTFKNGAIIYLYIFTSAILFLFSSIHHTFSCHSNDTWNCCYKLDLTGIMFELIAATICSLHFMFHDFETIRRDYIFLFLGIGLVTVCLSMFDFFISAQLNMFVMLLYASLFLLSFMSSIHWVVIAKLEEVEVISKYIIIGFTFMIVGFAFFLAKFPECVLQRSKIVDYFFQSHVIWHLCCLGCVICYYLMMENYNMLINNK